MRLIDANAIIYKKSKFDTVYRSPDMSLCHEKRTLEWVAKEDIDEMPTIEAEPIRHGHWDIIYTDNIPYAYRCSLCGTTRIDKVYYCPHCGAKMDLKEEEK